MLPKVVLINPSVKEVFPSPRLALCVSLLASYLRKYQKADVRIVDMQIGPTMNDIIKEVKEVHPDIIGISVSFGQLPLGKQILERIFSEVVVDRKPIVIAGNVISAFGCKGLLQKFPNLLVCNSEGERTLIDLVEYITGNKKYLNEVSGITYIENGEIKSTSTIEVDMDDIPLPAMDTLEGIIENRGSLTMEISRGCAHSACTFCPRTHKPRKWKGMRPEVVLKQLEYFKRIFDHFDVMRRIFMADEEFIGWIDGNKEAERIIKIMEGMIKGNFNLHFDQDTRIDRIYNLDKSKDWHVERMKMLVLCKKAGLDRLLVGVESGSDTVLERFNKKITANQSIMALRILTALGIKPRITFITFDPLMNFTELKKNVSFLERDDAFLQPMDLSKISYSELFDAVHDNDFVWKNSLHKPFYENIAYMVVNLEVLMNSHYVTLLKDAEGIYNRKLFVTHEPDYNMARYKVRYLNEIIGDIAINCQKWIDRHFAVDYCLKGMYKVASEEERKILFKFRANYRKLSFLLLKSLVWIFDLDNTLSLEDNSSDLKDIMSDLKRFKERRDKLLPNRIIFNVLELFNEKMKSLISNIESSINEGECLDENGQLRSVINQWKEKREWELINP